jgi:ferritin
LRLEKKRKEEEEHKKSLAAIAAKKKELAAVKKVVKPKFDRSKLNAAFMNNAKDSKDEVKGWALDFENES